MPAEIPGFTQNTCTFHDVSKPVYHIGQQKAPPIVLMHELPGMVPECVQLARELANEGFQVFMPLLFGRPNENAVLGNTLRVCLSREFTMFARGQSSPITRWLRALCRDVHQRSGGQPVGAIGMCLTGGFALSLMLDESVMAPVLSQPSLPIGLTRRSHADLGISPDELEVAQRRSEEQDIPVLALRFTCDPLCREARFATLRETFGERFRCIEIDSGPNNAHNIKRRAHSVLTIDRTREPGHPTEEAYREVVRFFHEQLTHHAREMRA